MTLSVTDRLSNPNEHIKELAAALRRSARLMKVFKAIFKGNSKPKPVSRLMKETRRESSDSPGCGQARRHGHRSQDQLARRRIRGIVFGFATKARSCGGGKPKEIESATDKGCSESVYHRR